MTKKDIEQKLPALKELEEIIGDTEVTLFFLAWLKNSRSAKAAYQELHPNVDENSAKTLGSRMLSKVDRSLVLAAYGLDINAYMTQLKDGLNAERYVDDGEGMVKEPDHKTRREYHKALGQVMGIEGKDVNNITVNVHKAVTDWTEGAYEEVEEAQIVSPVTEAPQANA